MPNNWEEAKQLNKEAIFAALAATTISEVTVRFDGYGDSGQIEEIAVQSGDSSVDLPNVTVPIHERSYNPRDVQITSVERSLREALETFCYDGLEDCHPGWEINEGSYGDFHFDVRGRTVRLEYNGRSIETELDEF
jgi:hypothetical protein